VRGDIEVRLVAEKASELEDLVRRTTFDEEQVAEVAREPERVQHELGLEGAGDPAEG
jgi:hypothetical protein